MAASHQQYWPDVTVARASVGGRIWTRAAGPAGGDFVLTSRIGPYAQLWVGDVTGHGLEAHEPAKQARRLILPLTYAPLSLSRWRSVSAALYRLYEGNRSVCLTAIQIDTVRRQVMVANAGNPPVLLHRGATGRTEFIGSTGMPLGLVDDTEWACPNIYVSVLGAEDQLLAFTDGLPDQPLRCDRLGLSRIVKSLMRAPERAFDTLVQRVTPSVERRMHDDVTVVATDLAAATAQPVPQSTVRA